MTNAEFNVDLRGAGLKAAPARIVFLGALLVGIALPFGSVARPPVQEPRGGSVDSIAGSGPAGSRDPAAALGASTGADSVAAREAAREVQARFERIRIASLPWTWSRSRGPCDEVVGRFCFWHEDEGEPWEPPPEAEPVTRAREALLDTLAAIAARLPGDGWIVGQRVRYLVEAGRAAEALRVARSSRADRAWRLALEGYALHADGDHDAAEAAFDRALDAMPADRARRWTDPSLLLDGPVRRLREGLSRASREAFDRRMWWLADPLWSVPGNERRSEHFARRVLDRMQEDARSAYDVRWGHDLSELVVRYGWPVGWERVRRDVAALGRDPGTRVISHDAPGGRRFVPSWTVLSSPSLADPSAWALDEERPRSTYAPAYARRFVDLEAQVAVFRRESGVRVVAGWALDPDSLDPASAVDAALVVSSGPDEPARVVRATTIGPYGVASLDAPAAPAVVGVEARSAEARTSGRSRRGLALPERISDLLVLTGGGRLPATLEEAASRARPDTGVRAGERIGVYLELYPPPGVAAAAVAVSARSERDGGAWRALGRALGFGEERSAARLAWTESLDGARIHPLPVTVELPGDRAGSYLLEVAVEWPDGRRSRARRRLERLPE